MKNLWVENEKFIFISLIGLVFNLMDDDIYALQKAAL